MWYGGSEDHEEEEEKQEHGGKCVRGKLSDNHGDSCRDGDQHRKRMEVPLGHNVAQQMFAAGLQANQQGQRLPCIHPLLLAAALFDVPATSTTPVPELRNSLP